MIYLLFLYVVLLCVLFFFFQVEDGIRDAHEGLEFRRVLFRSKVGTMIEAFDCGRFGAIIEFEGHSMLLRRDWRASTRRSNCSSRRQWASCHPGRLSPVRVRRGPFSISAARCR